MSSLLEQISALAGPVSPQSAAGKYFRSNVGVIETKELRRIRKLTWREWTKPDTEDLVRLLSAKLKTPHGTQTLFPIQAIALAEIHDYRGMLGPIGVSHGKALISLLAAVVAKATRPVLFIPANLRDQTLLEVLPTARKHWKIYEGLTILTYEKLSQANFDLEAVAPDMIILDEGHAVRDRNTARTKKLMAYLRGHPACMLVDMSGTLTSRSVLDYQHMGAFALGEKNLPLPSPYHELDQWSKALDEGVDPVQRIPPGALVSLLPEHVNFPRPEGMDETTYARRVYSLRLTHTPGVVATDSSAETRSSLRLVEIPRPVSRDVALAIQNMRDTWETPSGDIIMTGVELWRHARELACGFFYRWDPKPPEEWLTARAAWRKYVYETLKNNRRGLYSPKMVANEILNQPGHEGEEVYQTWKSIEKDHTINTVPVWISDECLHAAHFWLRENNGLCWVEHVEFGARLAEISDYPYFGAGSGQALIEYKGKGPAILSIAANHKGKNLEAWSRSLLVSPPPSNSIMEQLIGRTHRKGQLADDVVIDVMLGDIPEVVAGFVQSKFDAHYTQDTTGMKQKMCFADYDVSKEVRELFGAPGISPAALEEENQALEESEKEMTDESS